MGMFDSVWAKCPKCDEENEFQSKSGDCICANYDLDDCPDNVFADINRHSPCECDCGAKYSVDMETKKPILSE